MLSHWLRTASPLRMRWLDRHSGSPRQHSWGLLASYTPHKRIPAEGEPSSTLPWLP